MIFISYRREDTKTLVTHLQRRLADLYGKDQVFVDFHDIPAGQEWPGQLRAQLELRQLVLVIVGEKWGGAKFESGDNENRLRLDDPNDWVRQEITSAVRARKKIIVVPVDDARLPGTKWSCELDYLPNIQQARLRHQSDFERDFENLRRGIEALLPELCAAPAHQPVQPPRAAELVKSRVDLLERMRTRRSLRIGFVHYPPFAVAPVANEEQPSGLYVDLLRALCTAEGIVPQFEQIRFTSALTKIGDDSLDVILSIFETARRRETVAFDAFLHAVTVSAVVRRRERRILSPSDLVESSLRVVVCEGEIGHEIAEDHFKIPDLRVTVIRTSNISEIIDMVATGKADVAIADSLSCQHGLAARGLEGPRLKAILRRPPLHTCPNGVMLAKGQAPLAAWLNQGLKTQLRQPEFRETEKAILKNFRDIILKL